MTIPENNRHQQLAQWILRLIEILRSQENATWQTLVRTVAGKRALMELDGIQLQLTASENDPLQVRVDYITESPFLHFSTTGEILRSIIAGQLTIDKAIIMGELYLRATLDDILGIHQLVIDILADSPLNPQLQELWREFDQDWISSPVTSALYSLQNQKIIYGELIQAVPRDTLLGEDME
ncbi:hypothetical protein PN462_03720 [Spirulina sp. CS-785/01]|uniref:hypothetical protein n=1 Tax=Spirulina sp. CS-785/01 TaxID=3021716 RepID=UPI00233002D5|nr:hypothetical protein [Spirulina sp. CS-785/01]MDB9312199.1 hypothetical protein [Spirulina sp. CS-785/01]